MAGICWVSGHRSFEAMLSEGELIERTACCGSWVELRLDRYADRSPERLREALRRFEPRKAVVTFRASEEGGCAGAVPDDERLVYWQVAQEMGAAYVDIELQTLLNSPGVRDAWENADSHSKLIVSVHDFMKSPSFDELRQIRRDAENLGADLIKIAVSPKSVEESIPLLDLIHEAGWKKPMLALAMGDGGLWSRVLAPAFPCAAPFTFARREQSGMTAPGQPLGSELETIYRFRSIGAHTQVWGLIGDPMESADRLTMYNQALHHLGIDGVFLPFKVERDSSDTVQKFFAKLKVAGLAVSPLYQEKVVATCRELAATAAEAGRVDTIVTNAAYDVPHWEGHLTSNDIEAQFRLLTGQSLVQH